jgi:DnaJ domain
MSPYDVLGVARNASERDIRKAYCALALRYHPDKNPSGAAKFREATDAYLALKNGTSAPASSTAPVPWSPPSPAAREPSWARPSRQYEPPGPPDPSRPWSPDPTAWDPSRPRTAEPTPQWTWGPRYTPPNPWAQAPTLTAETIEAMFYQEFGIRWSDLPREAQEVLSGSSPRQRRA